MLYISLAINHSHRTFVVTAAMKTQTSVELSSKRSGDRTIRDESKRLAAAAAAASISCPFIQHVDDAGRKTNGDPDRPSPHGL